MPASFFHYVLLLLLIVVCITLGWYLGRRGRSPSADQAGTASLYSQGINKRLNDRARQNSHGTSPVLLPATAQANIAAANLLREQGKHTEAISAHQELLSAPELSSRSLHIVRFELARDYIVAGHLDRAERLLVDLQSEAPELCEWCQQHLMEIYQEQGEWQQAIDIGLALLPIKPLLRSTPENAPMRAAVAHYYCELATLAMAKNDYHAVRGYLKQALTYDRNCVRASFLLGEAEYNSQHYAEAVKVFHKIRKQDPLFIADSVVLLARCYEALGQPNQLYRYLRDCMENYPSTGLLLVLADEMQRREGNAATARYLEDALKGQSSQRGMAGLLALYQADAEGETKQHMGTLKQLVEQRLHREPAYQCASCGHESRFNHWLCPGCHCWGQVKPVQY